MTQFDDDDSDATQLQLTLRF